MTTFFLPFYDHLIFFDPQYRETLYIINVRVPNLTISEHIVNKSIKLYVDCVQPHFWSTLRIKIESLENCVTSYVYDGTIPIVISIILERKATYIEWNSAN